ncbi:uncharacterized protein METZ01_LOCUS177581, partial [marine metagenome]
VRRPAPVLESSRPGQAATGARAKAAAADDAQPGRGRHLLVPLRRLRIETLRSASVDQGAHRGL